MRSQSWWTVVVLWALLAGMVALRPQRNAFAWDSFAYHLYLPAYLIHHDPALTDKSWIEHAWRTYEASDILYQITERDGHRVPRTSMGVSVLWAPWFIVGHMVARSTGAPADGYSAPYQWAVVCGVLVYILLGLLALRRVLRASFGEGIAAITLCLLVVGTNYLDQATAGITGPHILLFQLYAGILYFTHRWHLEPRRQHAMALGLLMGFAALVRPTDVVCVLLPLFWGEGPRAWMRHRAQAVMIAVIMFVVGLPQLLHWKLATGHFVYDSYANPGEGLDLLAPHTFNFLFSFRKGWYIYTPMLLLATLGILPLRKAWPAAFSSVLIFFLMDLYLVSSWSCWWYADSFSSRAMVNVYAVMALPLAALVQWAVARAPRKKLMFALFTLITSWHLFQYWQFSHGIIHSQRMTWAAYKASLLRTKRVAGMEELLLTDRSHDALQRGPDPARYSIRTLPAQLTHIGPSALDTLVMLPDHPAPTRAFRLTRHHAFSPATRIPYEQLLQADHAWVKARWHVFIPDSSKVPVGTFVMTSEHGGSYSYQTNELSSFDLRPGWNEVNTRYMTPEVRRLKDDFAVYYWSRDTVPVLVSGPQLQVLDPIGAP